MAETGIGSEVSQSVENTAKSTANGIKTAKRIAENAAAGNVAGVAVEVVKNPTAVIAILLVASLLPIILGAVLFYAAPMALYETLQSLANEVSQNWELIKEDFYSGDGGVVERFGNAARGVFARMWTKTTSSLKSLWDAVTAKKTDGDKDDISDADVGVMGVTADAVEVYKRKVEAVKDKLTARTEAIASQIEGSCYGSVYNEGCINGWIYRHKYLEQDYSMYQTYDQNWWLNGDNYEPGIELPDDVVEVVYGGVTPIISKHSIKTKSAVDLIALYSALRNTTAENVQVYELMKWMGYKGVGGGSNYFVVGDAISLSVDGWVGTFMPKYLEDEKAALANHNIYMDVFAKNSEAATTYADLSVFKDYQAPVVDLIITVGSSPLANLRPQVTFEKIQHWEKISDPYTTIETGYGTKYLDYTYFVPSLANNKYVKGVYGKDFNFRFVDGILCKIPLNNEACREWLNLYGYEDYTYTYEVEHEEEFGYVERNRAILSYSVSASIGIRSTVSLSELAGFTSKPPVVPIKEEDEAA